MKSTRCGSIVRFRAFPLRSSCDLLGSAAESSRGEQSRSRRRSWTWVGRSGTRSSSAERQICSTCRLGARSAEEALSRAAYEASIQEGLTRVRLEPLDRREGFQEGHHVALQDLEELTPPG